MTTHTYLEKERGVDEKRIGYPDCSPFECSIAGSYSKDQGDGGHEYLAKTLLYFIGILVWKGKEEQDTRVGLVQHFQERVLGQNFEIGWQQPHLVSHKV